MPKISSIVRNLHLSSTNFIKKILMSTALMSSVQVVITAQILVLSLLANFTLAQSEVPFELPQKSKLRKLRSAVLETNKGEIILELFPEIAPWHVANLKYLADKGFYKNMRIHMHEPDYMVQMGAPGKKVNSGPGYTLPPEFSEQKHIIGAVSMVRKPDLLDQSHMRRSHGSQFRIFFKPNRDMDGQYTVFGRVIAGIDVAKRLQVGDVLKDLKVFVRREE